MVRLTFSLQFISTARFQGIAQCFLNDLDFVELQNELYYVCRTADVSKALQFARLRAEEEQRARQRISSLRALGVCDLLMNVIRGRITRVFSNKVHFIKMSEEAHKARVRIGTHNGTFHCDEVLACFLLRQLPEYKVNKSTHTDV